MKTATVLYLTALLLFMSQSSRADSDDAAAEVFNYGASLFEDGKFLEAAQAFKEADKLAPSWKVRYYLGRSEELAGRNGLAIDAYESYLEEGGNNVPKERREAVEASLSVLREKIAYVTASGPAGAELFVDGMPRGTLPLIKGLVVSSDVSHVVQMRQGEKVIATKDITLPPSASAHIEPNKTSTQDTSPARGDDEPIPSIDDRIPELEAPEANRPALKTAGWITLWAGAGLATTGFVVGGIALSQNRDLDRHCVDGVCPASYWSENDAAKSMGIAADVLIWTGAAALATGAVLLIVNARKKESNTGTLSLAPQFGPDFSGALMQGRF